MLKLDKLGGLASPWRPCLHVSEVRIRPPIVDNIDRFRIEDTAHKTISTGATHTRNAVCIPSSFGLPKWRRGKEPACQRRRYGFHLQVGKIPWRRKWQPTPVFFPGEFHGQRILVGYSPWGGKESDMTERLHFHFPLSCIGEGNGNPLQCSCLENPKDGGA